jgi:hypothetical protein
MALTIATPQKFWPGQCTITLTQITLDASYAAGGIPVTPAQLGLTQSAIFGHITVRTAVATHSPGGGTVDCTNPAQPKLKLVGESNLAELGAGQGSGAVLDVLTFGV